MFLALPSHGAAPLNPSSTLAQWTGKFHDLRGQPHRYTMAGGNPHTTNTTTTIPVVVVPVKLVYGPDNGNMTFDPETATVSNGLTVEQNTLASPLFNAGIDFNQGGTDLGNTQYIDAFQRGNFWLTVNAQTSGHSNYHVLFGTPTVGTELTVNVSTSEGQVIDNPFGSGVVGLMNINSLDTLMRSYISSNGDLINPGVLPIFLTYDVYLTSGGACCIGGYHSAEGQQPNGQTYSQATYEDSVGSFSQDVSALSHELGEWMDDPFIDNSVNCNDNSLMEVGDPLEGKSNYGAYPYTLNGFTYNLQSLVFIDYFGAPRLIPVNQWLSFQNDETNVCPGQ
jgi:hypothetical protein